MTPFGEISALSTPNCPLIVALSRDWTFRAIQVKSRESNLHVRRSLVDNSTDISLYVPSMGALGWP